MIEIQRKRIHSSTTLDTAGVIDNLIYTTDESNGVNVHGFRISMSFEPVDANANANIVWSLLCIPDETSLVPSLGNVQLEAEGSNAFIIATGNVVCSNETPVNVSEEIRTSRNCQNGARIVLQHFMQGVSAGNVRVLKTLQCFTTGL